MSAADSAATETRMVMDMTGREFSIFDKENFHPENQHRHSDEERRGDNGKKHNFHRHLGFSDAKVAIKFKF